MKVAQKMRRVMKKHHMNFESVFNNMDKSNDSKLDWRELQKGVRTAVDIDLSDREASALVARFDRDNDGTVDIFAGADVLVAGEARVGATGSVNVGAGARLLCPRSLEGRDPRRGDDPGGVPGCARGRVGGG